MHEQAPDNQLRHVNRRLDHLEDMVSDILESGREMDENLTAQLQDVRHEISMQHETLRKMKQSKCSMNTIYTIIAIAIMTLWTIIIILY